MPRKSRRTNDAQPSLLERPDIRTADIAAVIEGLLSEIAPSKFPSKKVIAARETLLAIRGGVGGAVVAVVVSFQEQKQEAGTATEIPRLVALWNTMAELTGAHKLTAIKGPRLKILASRLKEKNWFDTASRAIAYLGADDWYRANPSAIRFDVLLRKGKAEVYVELSEVKRNGHGSAAKSKGGARDEVDRAMLDHFDAHPEAGRHRG